MNSRNNKNALMASFSTLKAIFNTFPDSVIFISLDGTIIFANKKFIGDTGYVENDVISKKYDQFISDFDERSSIYTTAIAQALETGVSGPWEFRFLNKKDKIRHFGEANLVSINLTDGPQIIAVVIHDVTQRVISEKALKEMALFPDQNTNPVIRVSLDGRILYANQAAQIILDHWHQKRNGKLSEELRKRVLDIWNEDKNIEQEVEIGNRMFLLEVKIIKEKEYLNMYAQDITERYLANQELQDRERRLQEAERIAKLGHWEWDIPSDHIVWSDGVYRIFGLQPDDFVPTFDSYSNYVHPDDVTYLHDQIDKAIRNRTPYSTLHRGIRKDGKVIIVSGNGKVLYAEDGKPLKMVGTVQDVTELKETEERLKVAERIAKVGNWEWNILENSVSASDEAIRIMGITTQDFTYQDFLSYVSQGDIHQVKTAIRELVLKSIPLRVVYRIGKSDGHDRYARLIGELVYSKDEKPVIVRGTIQDVTEQVRVEETIRSVNLELEKKVKERTEELARVLSELEIKEQQNRTILNDLTEMVFRWKPDGTILFMNSKIKMIYATPSGAELNDYPNLFTREQINEIIQDLSRNSKVISNEYSITNDNGEERCEEWTHRGIFNDQGNLIEVQSVGRDITAAKKASEVQRKLSLAVNYSPVTVVITDSHGVIEYVNPAFEKITGYSEREILGQKPSILKSGHHDKGFYNNLWLTITSGNVWVGEFINRKKNGEQYIESASIAPIMDEKGEVTHFIAVKEDVTQQRQAEQAIRESERKLQDIINHAPIMVYMYDLDGLYSYVNDEFVSIQKIPREEIIGKTDFDILPRETAQLYRDYFHKAIQMKEVQHFESTLKKGSRVKFFTHVVFPLMNNDGNVYMVVGKALDTTEQKEAETAIIKARKAAEEANQAKSSFVANMSHEIRTPLNAVIGMAHILQQTDLNEKQRDYTEKISRASESLLEIIKGILDFSKIESGRMDIESIPFDIRSVFKEVENIIGISAKEKGLEAGFLTPQALPKELIGDPLRLQQVLVNLCGNAIKFTDTGKVVLSAQIMKQNEKNISIKFSVKDTGIGLSAEQISRLFSAFTQADSSITRRYGGTGLGLAISQQLVELMGGRIKVKSQPGVGSDFYFTVNFRIPSFDDYQKNKKEEEVDETSVLIISNDPMIISDLQSSISTLGYHIINASSMKKGLDYLNATSLTNAFKIIGVDSDLLDSGVAGFIKQIRAIGHYIKTPILIISSSSVNSKTILDKFEPIGFITKPISQVAFSNALFDALRVTPSRNSNEKNEEGLHDINILAGLNLLIVEDNEINQEVAKNLVEMVGAKADLALNGFEALNLLKDKDYDAVLMDVQMPVMDGIQTTRRIRESEMLCRDIPIIALTANAALEDVEGVLKNGMSDIVLKPIDPISLYATLKKWIKKNEPLAIKESKEKQISQSIFPSILKGINMKDGLRRFGGDQQHYKKILLKFLDDQNGIVEKINEAIENGDKNNAKILTHTLKGVAGNIGAEQVYMDAEQFESSILNDDKSSQKKSLAQLGKSLQQVFSTIQNLKTDLPAFPQQKLNGDMVIDQSEISALLSDLMIALQNGDTASFAIIEKFANQMEQKDPEINIYLESIQNLINEYDFDGALSEVVLLAQKLDIEIKQGP